VDNYGLNHFELQRLPKCE